MGITKVAQVTAWFWVLKICATTLGETAGDLLSMTLKVGYGASSLLLLGVFCVLLTRRWAVDVGVPRPPRAALR